MQVTKKLVILALVLCLCLQVFAGIGDAFKRGFRRIGGGFRKMGSGIKYAANKGSKGFVKGMKQAPKRLLQARKVLKDTYYNK